MSDQLNFEMGTVASAPVECLGQNFPNEDARREHFLSLLAEKLKDPEFRNIEGFPIGTDEAILAMSDPPYYTACPNRNCSRATTRETDRRGSRRKKLQNSCENT